MKQFNIAQVYQLVWGEFKLVNKFYLVQDAIHLALSAYNLAKTYNGHSSGLEYGL